jgi:hypothetical protein
MAAFSLCLTTAAAAPAAALAAEAGAIAGTVTAAETAAPLSGIRVCVYAASATTPVGCQATSASGEYEASGLAPGQYEVEFSSPDESGLNYLTQFYKGAADRAAAEKVTVEGGVAAGVDAALMPGGRVAGHVTEAEGKPVSALRVCALAAATGASVRCVSTDEAGDYTIVALPTGDYEIEFSPGGGSQYVKQFYDGAAARQFATPVHVEAGAPAPSQANATLQRGGSIGGTVTSAASKKPLAGVLVCAADPGLGVDLCASTASDGRYAIGLLPAGSYRVRFDPTELGGAYAPQFYEAAQTEADARPIAVAPGSGVSAIDAVLQGVPVALLKPAIVGRPIVGQTLTMLRGTWTNSPLSVTDEWGRCDSTGAIESCSTVAGTPTYTLSDADVGHTIRIREKVSNEYGLGVPEYLFSPPTGIVLAGTPHAPPAAVGPAARSVAVLSSTARAATTAQLKALLASVLVPRGRNAKIGALLRHRGYAVSFHSLAAGRLAISWYLLPKSAHVAGRRPVLAAVGKLSMPASGSSRLKIKLTARGRRLLRHRGRVKLTAKGVLAASGRPRLSATRSFRLKR